MNAKQLIRELLRNLLLAAVVFLPIFLLANVGELKLRGVELSKPVWYHASGAVVIYLGLLLPVLLGAIAHGVSLLLIPSRVSARTRRIAVVVLAPLIPFTVVLSGLAPILADFPGSAAIATLVYGMVCATDFGTDSITRKRGGGTSRKTAV